MLLGLKNNIGGIVIPPIIKDSIVLWYDIDKQGMSDIISTNKLKDISNNRDGNLIGFGFTGGNKELVFDGVGYIKTNNLLILTNYTGIAKRTNINNIRLFNNKSSSPYINYKYYCTDLKKEILWNGSNWIDYNGNMPNIPKKGTTAQRPTGVQIGYTYKDTDLGKWIIWGGDAWENIDGSPLE